MPDIFSEDLLAIADAAKELPERPHCSTMQRWHKRGIRGVKLEAIRIGGRWFTSRQALQRFVRNTTAAAVKGQDNIDRFAESSSDHTTDQALDEAGL